MASSAARLLADEDAATAAADDDWRSALNFLELYPPHDDTSFHSESLPCFYSQIAHYRHKTRYTVTSGKVLLCFH